MVICIYYGLFGNWSALYWTARDEVTCMVFKCSLGKSTNVHSCSHGGMDVLTFFSNTLSSQLPAHIWNGNVQYTYTRLWSLWFLWKAIIGLILCFFSPHSSILGSLYFGGWVCTVNYHDLCNLQRMGVILHTACILWWLMGYLRQLRPM